MGRMGCGTAGWTRFESACGGGCDSQLHGSKSLLTELQRFGDEAAYHQRMSSQKFSAAQREAIWRAYGMKCVYSRRLLDVSNFHIDHVVPETLADDPAELARTLTMLGLESSFDLSGWENLVPCLPERNLQKGSVVFDPNNARYFLGIAAARKASVIEELKKIERRATRGKAIVMLQQALENGKLKPDEVARIIQEHEGEPAKIFDLLVAMEFSDAAEVQAVKRDELECLRDRPIRLGHNGHIEGVELTGPNDEKRLCRTCREYETAIREGYYANSTFDMKIATRFEHQCGLLRALDVARIPASSFVSDPRTGIHDLDLMPLSFFPASPDCDANAEDGTYQDKLDRGQLVVKRIRGNLLELQEPEGFGQLLIEVTRADFNGDGIEDILLFEYGYATHGTMGWGGIKLITRLSADAKFSVVELPT